MSGADTGFDGVDKPPQMSKQVREAIRRLPSAPLKTSVDKFLAQSRNYVDRQLLLRIASLNQGTVADLDRADFRSYVIARTGLTEDQLRKCVQALRSFMELTGTLGLGEVLVAARGDKPEEVPTAAEIWGQLKKRKS